MVPIAHGGDGGGSIRIPAAHCGLIGLKASRGRFPSGPYRGERWNGLVSEGILSRSVRDTALILNLASGSDIGAPYASPAAEDFLSVVETAESAPRNVSLSPNVPYLGKTHTQIMKPH